MDETDKAQLTNALANEAALSQDERAILYCQRARELETIGDYEAARELLTPFWKPGETRPNLSELNEESAAELLLRAGTLSGWLGTLKRIDNAQERAKD